ncbi:1,2-phenylacetyl-CoA epoxidase subunit PaaE [Stackebrandtia soli]|uniref:1,2-phenylacetyl-CoA epoxidase subunit PaaE n=1 Tax=Stackebrandtia soli TaxID=1892856 RepID=UPI0039EB5D90
MAVVLSRPKHHRPRWHSLPVVAVDRITDEAVRVTLGVPPKLRSAFDFSAGQHLTFRRETGDGEEIRRSYSICSTPSLLADEGLLRVGIKAVKDGAFSQFAHSSLDAGSVVDVLPPLGNFTTAFDPGRSRHYGAIAAGSGITPILSIVATALTTEPDSRVTLVFGNKSTSTVMFSDELADLKDLYADRFQLVHLLSREEQSAPLLNGRIDGEKLAALFDGLIEPESVDEWFLCGPYGMVTGAQKKLADVGVPTDTVHTELFFAEEIPPPPPAEDGPAGDTDVTFVLDGRTSTVTMRRDERVLDAALRVRSELPYACKGGVCATCRAKVVDGGVHMLRNFALDDSDVEAGYVLTCQSVPTSDRVVVDYDA